MLRNTMLCIPLIAVLSLSTQAATDVANPVKPQLKTRSVVAFKNGVGFIYKSGKVDLSDGWVDIGETPPASLGTVWIGTANPTTPVEQIVSYTTKVKTQADAVNMDELLAANVGKRVSILYNAGSSMTDDVKTFVGDIVSVPEDRKQEDNLPIAFNYDVNPSRQGYYSQQPNNNFNRQLQNQNLNSRVVILKAVDGQILVLNRAYIRAVTMPNGSNLDTTIEKTVPGAKARIKGTPKSADMGMAYLEKGIIWSPSYLIDIRNDKMAALTMDGVIANDAEDIEDADLSFAIGYPNFLFADVITPLSTGQSVAQFVQGISRDNDRRGSGGFNMAFQNVTGSFARGDSPQSLSNALIMPVPVENNEDLHLFHQSHVTLKKGDRARFTLLTASVPYQDIYTWDIPDSANVDDRGNRIDNNNRVSDDQQQVWHSIELTNSTKDPWTTAPAMVVNGDRPVSQDTLGYTPAGGKNTVKITMVTDVVAQQEQTELSRVPFKTDSRTFQDVTINGKLTIRNFKQTPITIDVTKTLVGDVVEAGQEGKVTKLGKKVAAINPTSKIKWRMQINPGEVKELNYQYKVLIYY